MVQPRDDAHGVATLSLNAGLTGVDRRTLDAIFRHPLSHNLSWREVVGLFAVIGGVEERHNGEFVLRAGDETLAMKRPHTKHLTGSDVMGLRHFLDRNGWSPVAPAKPRADPKAPDLGLVVVIDHAGAKIYRINRSALDGRGETGPDTKHLLHHLEGRTRDEDRAETWPDDERFFEQVADTLSTGGDIVVIGHGKGQSNEADHLIGYLKSRHKETHARIVRELVADLPHLTTPELLALCRHALGHGEG
jgi:hypothetical protein